MYRRKAQKSATSGRKVKTSLRQILTSLVLCCTSFYIGSIMTYTATVSSRRDAENGLGGEESITTDAYKKELHQMKLDYEMMKKKYQAALTANTNNENMVKRESVYHRSKDEASTSDTKKNDSNRSGRFFPPTRVARYFSTGLATTGKSDFVTNFDSGSPIDNKDGDVIFLYNTESSLPKTKHSDVIGMTGDGIASLSLSEATENCDQVNIATLPSKNRRVCTAIVQNFEDWHIRRWMRKEGDDQAATNNEFPFRPVNRGQNDGAGRTFHVPSTGQMQKHWNMLETYFKNFEDVQNTLKPIAEKVAVDNTIIILTCNMGQSELLMNFVCNARAKGFNIDNVLVFPTDKETKDLAEGLGLTTYHDEKNFGHLPSKEARVYGDRAFTAMMFAKVVCVQLINFLGFDLLFQDVDVIWHKNPLEYFHDENNPYRNFDMYFQDDGAHSTRYAPYSANSGFYYVRSNELTKYFFTSLLYHGDMIIESTSHQQALIQVMTEHASLFGLRVKVLDRESGLFPGGWHYHKHNPAFMKSLIKGEIDPIIFHMSWTKNKDDKIKFFQQLGEWYTNDQCVQHTRGDILKSNDSAEMLFEPCCLAEPNIVCHYRDKPSKNPCKDVDPIDRGRPSFW